MQTNAPAGLQGPATANRVDPLKRLDYTTKAGKRATHEALSLTPCDGYVEVSNESHADGEEHTYDVHLRDGVPTQCECPADEYHEGAYKHRVAVALARPVIEAVGIQSSSDDVVATDGGTEIIVAGDSGVILGEEGNDEKRPEECTCVDWNTDGVELPCFSCFRAGFDVPNPDASKDSDRS